MVGARALTTLSDRDCNFAYRVLTKLSGKRGSESGCQITGRITKRSVDALACPPGKDREFLWDDAVSGFGVAFPSGKKVYVAQYRHGGRSRRATIGEHGRLTPDEGRSEAKQLLGIVEAGSDPIAERRAAREVRTFKAVADFLSLHAATKRKARTVAEYRRILQARILPVIGSKRIVDVLRADVARLHAGLVRTPYEANRPPAVISAVWNWAARRDEVAAAGNPTKAIERYPGQGGGRFFASGEFCPP